ncbi:chromate resistance protein ChrB domain-containing protein [Microbulbifer sp. TYP-18]|uniref:chromate resistance protein ChrB domain-containing protein n=1 Tax=Microbulbifer sp. TYP-18 TaxID=3230024 RepID=UPI0034C5D106
MLAACGIAYAVIAATLPRAQLFVTWDSLEPDKWASIWLIKQHIDPDAVVEVRATGDPVSDGIPFGVPEAVYKRTGSRSAFESLLLGFAQTDPTLQAMGRIITTIETTAWNAPSDPLVHVVERNFRQLQDRYGRAYVPISCYAHFFDVLYAQLAMAAPPDILGQSLSLAVDNQSCAQAPTMAERTGALRVKEMAIENLLTEIALNKSVVFVDTREPAEFQRSHIPGAINIPMRSLNEKVYRQLRQADLVISYCVKDFRGYEVARQMLDNGLNNVAVMKPHGLSGWQSSGLPITSLDLPEKAALEKLMHCAKGQQECLK